MVITRRVWPSKKFGLHSVEWPVSQSFLSFGLLERFNYYWNPLKISRKILDWSEFCFFWIHPWWICVCEILGIESPRYFCRCTAPELWHRYPRYFLKSDTSSQTITFGYLGGGFKYFLFSPLPGEDFQFDEHIFQMGWFNHQGVLGIPFVKFSGGGSEAASPLFLLDGDLGGVGGLMWYWWNFWNLDFILFYQLKRSTKNNPPVVEAEGRRGDWFFGWLVLLEESSASEASGPMDGSTDGMIRGFHNPWKCRFRPRFP